MLKDITLGQYYPVDSIIHRLDPRTKLAGTMIYIVSLFACGSWIGYILAGLFLITVISLSKVPAGFMFRGLRSIIILLLISVVFNLFMTQGNILLKIGPLAITDNGLKIAIYMAIRLIFLVIGTSVMTLTTTPNALTDGLEKGLGFLKIIHVPVHEIAMMMSIALRFIPILTEETDKIMKAQMARGARFDDGGIIQRAKSMVPLLVPLFVSAYRRATDLAMAMEARCYHGGEGRTKMKPLVYRQRDAIAYICIFIYLVLMIVLKVWSR